MGFDLSVRGEAARDSADEYLARFFPHHSVTGLLSARDQTDWLAVIPCGLLF